MRSPFTSLTAEMVPTQFLVVKYVASILRDEPVNVAIVAKLNGRLELRATPKLARIKRHTGTRNVASVETALRFLRSMIDRTPNLELEDLANGLHGSLRCSDIFGGLTTSPEDYIEEQYETFVQEVAGEIRAANAGRKEIRQFFRRQMAMRHVDSEKYAIYKSGVKGASTASHSFDFGSVNGKVLLVRAISLQTDDYYALREARALSIAAVDTKKRKDLPGGVEIAAIVAPPLESSIADYAEALSMIKSYVDDVVFMDESALSGELDLLITHLKEASPLDSSMLVT